MRKHLYVDGKDLADFGVYISGSGTFNAPEKEVTTYRVPGRNGLVLGADERIENIEVTYPCFIYANFAANMRALRSYLLSRSGYVRIADDYDTTHFRMGYFEAGIDTEPNQMLTAGQFELTFNCQPQRWLVSGETEIAIASTWAAAQKNPSLLEAKPLIHITGLTANEDATIAFDVYDSIGYRQNTGRCIKIFDTFPYTSLYIDCELMEVYSPGTNNTARPVNQYVALGSFTRINSQPVLSTPGLDPPVIPGGGALVRYGTSSAVATMIPRWWEV